MRTNSITNDTIWTTDFTADQRCAALRSIPAMKAKKERNLAPGLSARGVWGQDVSAMDRRSVKASLAGRGDLRGCWWNVCSAVLRKLYKGSLEHAMYNFHRAHHALTLLRVEAARDTFKLAKEIQSGDVTNIIIRR